MNDHDFCRELLKQVMVDVCKHVPVEERKRAWTYKYTDFNTVEFHGPNDFYWHGSGCCKWYARFQGWTEYLASIGVEGYKIECIAR